MASLFTRILRREIPAEIVYEDDYVFAFRDINPQAPFHVLICPKTEVRGLDAIEETGDHTHLLFAARKIAEQAGLTDGYRLVINNGANAGQTVDHLHAHLLGGRSLGWPPG